VSRHDVAALVDRLDPRREPGRLTFIVRFGAAEVEDRLPELVDAVRICGTRPVWLSDPMHGNTVHTANGRKTRAVRDMISEVSSVVRVLHEAGSHPGGLHLEMSPDDVTECVGTRAEAGGAPELPRYLSACDPRLNAAQAAQVVAAFAAAVSGASGAASPVGTPQRAEVLR
jgi:3-deoxy-7-phosphoheptulonate synthase